MGMTHDFRRGSDDAADKMANGNSELAIGLRTDGKSAQGAEPDGFFWVSVLSANMAILLWKTPADDRRIPLTSLQHQAQAAAGRCKRRQISVIAPIK